MMTASEIKLRGVMRFDEPLSRHTTWRVGGPASVFYQPADSADLITFLQQLTSDEPLLWLGLGSNLLVRDGGFPGTVIATQGSLMAMALTGDETLRVEAGVPSAQVARFATRNALSGVEFLAGIPGTLGGALAMNAGAFGTEIWQRVEWVETVDRFGQLHKRQKSEFKIGYREVQGVENEWFLAAHLQLTPGDSTETVAHIRQLLERRAATQPTRQPSCGSVFRNPEGDYAARLIEAAGLKGSQRGGAQVSEKHANFIINTGSATAADIEALIAQVQDEVERCSGIRLQTEVHRVGVTG
ncbi:MAG: UDP-N-acetylmuramate dehydrogenase [Candidatus Polarisedimenticolaceae bacterium]|nr:UDP-N-acetylmuramate dehydrogenase [Candidatus Polarisedimenticolaceae bacterium]